jgi:hypothetical protein
MHPLIFVRRLLSNNRIHPGDPLPATYILTQPPSIITLITPDMHPNLPSSPSSPKVTPSHDPFPCETSSLLPHQDEDAPTSTPTSASISSSPSLTAIILAFMTLHFLLAFSEIILVAPLIKLFEQSLCLNYYDFPIGGVQEEWCKVPQVQGPLATIRGWKGAGDTLPGTFPRMVRRLGWLMTWDE